MSNTEKTHQELLDEFAEIVKTLTIEDLKKLLCCAELLKLNYTFVRKNYETIIYMTLDELYNLYAVLKSKAVTV